MNDALVVYFSCTGITENVAKKISKILGVNIFRIVPEVEYTKEDLDWTDSSSRSSVEMNDKLSRPKIINKIDSMDKYNKIFIGFPIWWYKAPTIINTFLEMYDLSGKTIIPFCTSGSSDSSEVNEYLYESINNSAKLLSAKRFSRDVTLDEINEWLNKVDEQ